MIPQKFKNFQMPELASHLKAGEMSDCENIFGKIFFLN